MTSPWLTWKRSSSLGNVLYGFMGTIKVCSIYFRLTRDSEGSYALSFELPQLKTVYGDSESKLKEEAEKYVDGWLTLAGVI